MANINPPIDREQAESHPTYVYQDRTHGIEIRMGPEKVGPPETTSFRYVIVFSGVNHERWEGYLYMETSNGKPDAAAEAAGDIHLGHEPGADGHTLRNAAPEPGVQDAQRA
jgi:hypothetical protein